jgi:hypothetical protein
MMELWRAKEASVVAAVVVAMMAVGGGGGGGHWRRRLRWLAFVLTLPKRQQ